MIWLRKEGIQARPGLNFCFGRNSLGWWVTVHLLVLGRGFRYRYRSFARNLFSWEKPCA
jgi:hypothetical protein